jgi:beta-lactamase superfamily II metal-dependent hydrolase
MRNYGLHSKIAVLSFCLISLVCVRSPIAPEGSNDFRFSVVDVGQGLSQIGVYHGCALIWDMGEVEGYDEWLRVYQKAGRPWINMIVLSHGDLDHTGGLSAITPEINWSGQIGLNAFEDTSIIRKRCQKWGKPIYFRTISQDDTMLIEDVVKIRCLWPPRQELGNQGEFEPNRYSLVFLITHGYSTILISSDIDSVACEEVFNRYGGQIQSDLFVVPHHGSIFSYNYSFFSSVQPNCAIISYGENTYGHPSQQIISLLFSMDCQVGFTAEYGSFFFNSNGYYWSQRW